MPVVKVAGRLTHMEAAFLLGVCDRTFRRYLVRYGEGGLEALLNKRLTKLRIVAHIVSVVNVIHYWA